MKTYKNLYEVKKKKPDVDLDKIGIKLMSSKEAEDFMNQLRIDMEKREAIQKAGEQAVERLFDATPKQIKEPSGFKRRENKATWEARQGSCYEFAAKTIMDNPSWTLIHGTLIPPIGPLEGLNYKHAWVQKNNIVYDPSHDGFYKKKEYNKKYKVKDVTKYNQTEMNINLVKIGHWGNWE